MDNNLKTYLEKQIQEYQQESESKKALYGDMMEQIEECKSQIRSLKAKEDVGFSLLSPISVDSAFRQQTDRLKEQMDSFEKQKEKYRKDILFCEKKIKEIKTQLEEYEKTAVQPEDVPEKDTAAEIHADEKLKVHNTTDSDKNLEYPKQESASKEIYDVNITDVNISKKEKADLNENKQEQLISRNDITYILHKLADIKGYVNVDRLRCRLEIEQLEEKLQNFLL